jgi:hypothetical protein
MASFSQSTVFKTALTQPNVDAAIKESFIMGRICADKDETMPSMPCRLNRFSCEHPWLGYRYCSDPVLNTFVAPCAGEYSKFIQKYADISACNERMKRALTDMANNIARKAWNESSRSDSRGRLCFYLGGINSISPFSSYAVENELVISEFTDSLPRILDQGPKLPN